MGQLGEGTGPTACHPRTPNSLPTGPSPRYPLAEPSTQATLLFINRGKQSTRSAAFLKRHNHGNAGTGYTLPGGEGGDANLPFPAPGSGLAPCTHHRRGLGKGPGSGEGAWGKRPSRSKTCAEQRGARDGRRLPSDTENETESQGSEKQKQEGKRDGWRGVACMSSPHPWLSL